VVAYVVARPRLTERERRSVATYDAVGIIGAST
jgi:hypothetical protein